MTLTVVLREMSRAISAGGLSWVCVSPLADAGRSPSEHRARLRSELPLNHVERLVRRQLTNVREPTPPPAAETDPAR